MLVEVQLAFRSVVCPGKSLVNMSGSVEQASYAFLAYKYGRNPLWFNNIPNKVLATRRFYGVAIETGSRVSFRGCEIRG